MPKEITIQAKEGGEDRGTATVTIPDQIPTAIFVESLNTGIDEISKGAHTVEQV